LTTTNRLLCVLLLGMMSLPLSANITFSLGGLNCTTPQGIAGLCSNQANAQTITFDGLAGTPFTQTFFLATYTGVGGSPFVNDSVSGQYAAPGATSLDPQRQDATDYLTVGSPNRPSEVDIAFSAPIFYFGFYMGSPDTYNRIQFKNNGTVIGDFTGNQLIPPGSQSWAVGEYVNFFEWGSTGITDIVMSSSAAAFETDNHAYSTTAVPDGGTTALLLGLAFGAIGLVTRRLKA
jgi:VPDSG-CTERM motif